MVVSGYLIAATLGWMVAQGAKYLLMVIKHKSFDHLRQLYLSGNMPSAHSATTISLATYIGFKDGFDSSIFALAILFAGVVMYDAMVLRRSVGEQGKSLTTLIKKKADKEVRLPRVAKGHEPMEVLVGALVGVLIGSIVYFATI